MKINSLKHLITGSENQILDQRSDIFIEEVLEAQKNIIFKLESEARVVKKDIVNLTDLHRKNTTSLTVAENVNPIDFVEKLQEFKVKLAVLNEKIGIAYDTLRDFQGESDNDTEQVLINTTNKGRRNNKRNK